MQRLKLISSIASAALMLAAGTANAAQNNQIGIVGLYKVDNPQAANIDNKKVDELGCEIRRIGIIAAAQGKIDLAQPNQFVFLACDAALLNSPENRNALSLIIQGGKRLAILEGNLTDLPDAKRSSAISGRQYILKISNYNNKDANKRDSDLNELSQEAAQLPDTYVTESFIGVNEALGLPTPDEVVILFYDNPEAGDRFRKNNGDLLQKIGRFNQAHLVDAVYYVGKATQ